MSNVTAKKTSGKTTRALRPIVAGDDSHRDRVRTRLEQEARTEAIHIADYDRIARERLGPSDGTNKSVAALLASAAGQLQEDPLEGLIEEIRIRLRTLQRVADFDADDLRTELGMLEARAEAALGILFRCGGINGGGEAASARLASWERSVETIDAAAEE